MGPPSRLALVPIALALTAVLGPATPAAAEYCRPTMPDHARDARGYTFEGRVTAVRTEGDNPPLTYITFSVATVYANRDSDRLVEGSTIELYSNPCDGFGLLGLKAGDEVLMSTSFLEAPDGPGTWNTAVWRIEAGRLQLLVLHGKGFEKVWFTSDRRIADADRLREVLALVAPGAAGVPDTATALPSPAGIPARVPWVPVVIVASGALLASLLRQRMPHRNRTEADQSGRPR